jgi:hypothetical protein
MRDCDLFKAIISGRGIVTFFIRINIHNVVTRPAKAGIATGGAWAGKGKADAGNRRVVTRPAKAGIATGLLTR